jgi:hypothetical protein
MNPQTRVAILQVLQNLRTRYQDPSKFVLDHGMLEMTKQFAEKDPSMLVKNVAKLLL